MRIAFHAYKEGVGKTTLSLMLSKALAESGYDILFIDRDSLSLASEIAGIKEDGLITQLALGKEPKNFNKTIKIGKGSIEIIKLFSGGIMFYKTIMEFTNKEKFKEFYIQLLRGKSYDFFVVDNPTLLSWENNPVTYEIEAFEEVFPNEISHVVLVSDPFEFSVDDSIIYLRRIGSESPIKWVPLAAIINFVVDKNEVCHNCLRRLMGAFGFPKGVIVGYNESVSSLSRDIETLIVLPEIRKLAEAIVNKDFKEEIIA